MRRHIFDAAGAGWRVVVFACVFHLPSKLPLAAEINKTM
jgi:hypothetical protein